MNAAGILIALVLGFIGGVVGALVTIEMKTDTIKKEIDDAVLGISHVNSQIKTLKDSDNALTVAIQKLIENVKRDRGAIWESLNGLWNDYDERHKAEPKKKPEEPEIMRRKSDEKRNRIKQLIITETAYENARKLAENKDISINDCINLITAHAIRDNLQVKRKKSAEPKTYRQILAVTPSFEKKIVETATAQGVSLSEFICFALENEKGEETTKK